MQYHRHVIVGCGLIGCFLGGVIGQRAPVSFIGRPEWLARLQRGIKFTDYANNEAHYAAVDEHCCEQLPSQINNSIIWLTVKNTALPKVLAELQQVAMNNSIVVCCQNGLGAAQLTREHLPELTVLQAIVGCNVVWNEQTETLHKATEGELYVELPAKNDNALVEELNLISHPLLSLDVRADIEAVAWAKLQLNLANAVNAIVNLPVKTMLLDKGCREVIALLMDELLSVTAAEGIELPRLTRVPPSWLPPILRLPNWLFRRVASAMLHIDPSARSSMWWDLAAGRLTEVDYLNGALVIHGAANGVGCPINEKVVMLVKHLETKALVANRAALDGNTLKNQLQLK